VDHAIARRTHFESGAMVIPLILSRDLEIADAPAPQRKALCDDRITRKKHFS
jgi:hypothetical protein